MHGHQRGQHLGEDLFEHLDSIFARQTGPNLRHEFAHGLARTGALHSGA
jgi:hypothetical protein